MSNIALNFIRQHRRAGGFAQAVLMYLAETMNEQSGLCCHSRESIAEYFSAPDDPCTVKRVDRALARLRALGFITSVKRVYRKYGPNGLEGGVVNNYTFPGLNEFIASGEVIENSPQNSQGVEYTEGVTTISGVTPTVSWGSPHGSKRAAPTVSGGSPHDGGINQKITRIEPESSLFFVESPSGDFDDAPPTLFEDETPPPDDVPPWLFDDLPVTDPAPASKPATKKPKRSRAASDAWPVEGDSIDAETRAAYIAVRKAKRVGPFTAKAYEQIKAQGEKFGRSMVETLGICIGRGWVYPYDSAFQQTTMNGKSNGIQEDRRGFVLTPQSEYDYEAGLRMFEERRAARRARDA